MVIRVSFDRFCRYLVVGDDVTNGCEFNAVFLSNIEDDFGISDLTAFADNHICQFAGLHTEVGASQSYHNFGGTLAEKSNFMKNGFLLLRLLSCSLGLEFLGELLDGEVFR